MTFLINPGFFAYDKKFRGGVSVAVADLNGNGLMEIVAGAGYGGGPHVHIFDQRGKLLSPGFMAFDPSFRGGVTVAVADLNNNHKAEIITTPTRGGKAEIKIYTEQGKLLNSWIVYKQGYNSGLELAVTDINNDNKLDIIFEAPLENTYFNNSQAQESATIILKQSSSGLQKTISVNRISNQIDIY